MLLVKHPQCFAPPGETVALGWWLRGRWFKSNLNICCYPHCGSATSIGKHMKLSLQKSRCFADQKSRPQPRQSPASCRTTVSSLSGTSSGAAPMIEWSRATRDLIISTSTWWVTKVVMATSNGIIEGVFSHHFGCAEIPNIPIFSGPPAGPKSIKNRQKFLLNGSISVSTWNPWTNPMELEKIYLPKTNLRSHLLVARSTCKRALSYARFP